MHLKDIQAREALDSEHYWPRHGSMSNLEYLGICLAGEVGEICNVIKKHSRGTIDTEELSQYIGQEAPDVLIYLVMLVEALDIDLEIAYEDKKEYNEQRYRTST